MASAPERSRDAEDFGDREIGLDRAERLLEMRTAADLVGLVGLEAVQRELVLLGEDPDGLDPKLVRRAKNPDGDLRAVRDENLPDFRQIRPPSAKLSRSLAASCCNATDLVQRKNNLLPGPGRFAG